MRRYFLAWLAIGALTLPARAVAAQSSGEGQFTASDGVHIHYLTRGSGPPLLLLHGFALTADLNWVGTGAIDSLAGAFTVIAPDFRGHGASDKPHDPSAYGARLVADVIELLDHLKIDKAHVAGYSLGGLVTLKLIATHPERVRSAILVGAGWQRPGEGPPPRRGTWLVNLERAAREHTSVAEALLQPGEPPLPARDVAILDRNDPAALAAALRSAAALTVLEPEIRSLTTPVHVVVGEVDLGARAAVESLTQLRPDIAVTIVPGADHRRTMSDPRVAAAIRAFLTASPQH